MKKYTLLFIALTAMAFASCTKSGTNGASFTYSIGSLSNITWTEYVDTTITETVPVTVTGGTTTGTLTITPTGMPAGVTVLPTTFVGIGTFTTAFVFTGTPTVSGTFPITLTTANASGSKQTTFNIVVNAGAQFSYAVTGVPTTINLNQYTDTNITLPLSVGYISGTAGIVTLSGGTLPTGVTLFTASPASGTPTFSSNVSMNLSMNTAGTFPVTIDANSPGTATQAYTFNVVVAPSSNCVPEVTGTYTNAVTSCTPALTPYPTNIVVSATGTSGQIDIDALGGLVNTTATLNCSTGTVTSMTGSNADFTLTGTSGTFNSSQIILNYSLSGSPGNYTCTTTLTR